MSLFTRALSTNNYGPARFIVDGTNTANGTHSTIASAVAAALADGGGTVAIRDGTYTEDITLPALVNLVSWPAIGHTPSVTILGNITCSDAGSRTISGIRLQTNGAPYLTVSGSAATVVYLDNCFLDKTNNTGFSCTSSSASSMVTFINCHGDIATTGITEFVNTGVGIIEYHQCFLRNTGNSTTASTSSAGLIFSRYSIFFVPITTSGTAGFTPEFSFVDTSATNTKCLIIGGSGQNFFYSNVIGSGTATAMTITGSVTSANDTFQSTNATAAIDGAGTLIYSDIVFRDTGRNITVTTQTVRTSGPSKTVGSANSGGTNTFLLTNTSNTASSSAFQNINVGGTSAGDPFQTFTVSGTTNWSQGIDNSVTGDPYKLSASTALGTTDVMVATTAGEITYPLQPAFLARGLVQNNVTGAGTPYTVLFNSATIYDQNSDFSSPTFTAPVTGRYKFDTSLVVGGVTVAMTSGIVEVVTSNRSYVIWSGNPGTAASVSAAFTINGSVEADMDAADTATVLITLANGVGDTADILNSTTQTYPSFSGYLFA